MEPEPLKNGGWLGHPFMQRQGDIDDSPPPENSLAILISGRFNLTSHAILQSLISQTLNIYNLCPVPMQE